jgi:DHA2 family multidrug resistance protein-like MFS transporter
VLAVFGCFGSYVALLFLLMQWFQQTRGFSPLEAGAAIVPLAVANALGAMLAPWLVNRFGARIAMTSALASFGIALGFFAFSSTVSSYSILVLVLVVAGFGAGIIMTSGADAITSAVRPERAGEAAAIQETSFELSAGIGVAVLGCVLAVGYRLRIPELPFLSGAQLTEVRATVASTGDIASHLPPAAVESLLSTVNSAFDHGIRLSVGCAAFVLLLMSLATLVLLRNTSHPTVSEIKKV